MALASDEKQKLIDALNSESTSDSINGIAELQVIVDMANSGNIVVDSSMLSAYKEAVQIGLDWANSKGITDTQLKDAYNTIKSEYTTQQQLQALKNKADKSLAAYNQIRDARLAMNKKIYWGVGIVVVLVAGWLVWKYVIKK